MSGKPLLPGMVAPGFSDVDAILDGEVRPVSLSDYDGRYVVLLFYPEDFSWICPTELIGYNERLAEFEKLGAAVLAISCDTANTHLAFVNTNRREGGLGKVNIPLLSDKNTAIAKAYGCLKEESGVTFRALYIIDDKRVLRQITVNDFPVGRCVDETLRLVQAFKFTDKHGEVCPVNWKPGRRTLKTNREGITDYLKEREDNPEEEENGS